MGRTAGQPGALYAEAMPSFSVLAADASLRRGASILFWLDEQDALIGSITFASIDDQGLAAEYSFNHTTNTDEAQGTLEVDVLRSARSGAYDRPQLVCGRCGKNRERFHYVNRTWACRECHRLCYLTQRLSAREKDYARLDELVRLLKEGRPLNMRTPRYLSLCEERKALAARLVDVPRPIPHAGLRHRLTEHWVTEAGYAAFLDRRGEFAPRAGRRLEQLFDRPEPRRWKPRPGEVSQWPGNGGPESGARPSRGLRPWVTGDDG